MRHRRSFPALLVLAAAAVFATTASAVAPVTFTFGNGTWMPGTGHDSQFGLVTSSDASGTFGGASIENFPSDPNSVTALSFDFNANVAGPSGGSPRLVVRFSDGGSGDLRPLEWTAGTWTTVDGINGNSWDNNGGTCGFLYATTWGGVKACHAGASISRIFVVNDSGWLYPTTGETVIIDDITVNDLVAGGPGNSK